MRSLIFKVKSYQITIRIKPIYITDRIIQKITKQFANHLKGDDTDADSSLELIQKVFQLEVENK